ncbi:hypothetical protein F5B21DRAFT_510041 [Xylaria acuta]|nr:hypothetical protein F5B21DRAFT_510041 [Xylaria acuta]
MTLMTKSEHFENALHTSALRLNITNADANVDNDTDTAAVAAFTSPAENQAQTPTKPANKEKGGDEKAEKLA